MNTKQCTKCKEIKTIDNFISKRKHSNGHTKICKICRDKDLEYYLSKREEKKKYKKEYYENNRGNVKENIKEYRLNNKEHIKKVRAEYYQKNKEKTLKERQEYYQKNKEQVKKRTAKYAKTDKGIAIRRNVWHKRTMLHRETDITTEYLKNKLDKSVICYYCFKILDEKHIDHFNPVAKGGKHTKNNIVICCPTCNLTKSAKDPIKFIYSL